MNIYSLPPYSAHSTDTKPQPNLSNSAVFNKIRPLICSIISSIGQSSGFVISRTHEKIDPSENSMDRSVKYKKTTTILTATYYIPKRHISNDTFQCDKDCVQVNYGLQANPLFPTTFKLSSEQTMTKMEISESEEREDFLAKEKDEFLLLSSHIQLTNHIELTEGMKVYYAGYALGQNTPSFHKGIISSITKGEREINFTIDGHILPGNIGGPVVIQQEGSVYLVGIITLENTDFSIEDQATISIMKDLDKARRNLFQTANSNTIKDAKEVDDKNRIYSALDLLHRKIATKIGKTTYIQAVHINQYKYDSMFGDGSYRIEYQGKTTTTNGLIVHLSPIKEALLTGEIENEVGDILAKYVEVRYEKGIENCGIRLKLYLKSNSGIYNYRFKFVPSPTCLIFFNPKDPKVWYHKVAEEIYDRLIENDPKKLKFEFEFKNCLCSVWGVIDPNE